jgi:hypothetical protein
MKEVLYLIDDGRIIFYDEGNYTVYLPEDRNRRITVYFTDDGRIISYLMTGGLYHTEDGSIISCR